jgi:hypothetical protein
VAPTGRSNIGFNARCLDPTHAARLQASLLAGLRLIPPEPRTGTPWQHAHSLRTLYGDEAWRALEAGLQALFKAFPTLLEDELLL